MPNNLNYKVVFLCETSVGKSSIVSRFTRDEFFEYKEPTIGAAFQTKSIHTDNGFIVNMIKIFEGLSALSPFRKEKLISQAKRISKSIDSLDVKYLHILELNDELNQLENDEIASFDPWETGVSWSKYTISSFSGNLLRVSSTKFLSCAAYISSFFILFGSTNEILAKFSSLIRLIMFATLLEHSGLFKVGI